MLLRNQQGENTP